MSLDEELTPEQISDLSNALYSAPVRMRLTRAMTDPIMRQATEFRKLIEFCVWIEEEVD